MHDDPHARDRRSGGSDDGGRPAEAQIPGLGDAGRLLDRVPSLSSFLEGDPPITTSLDDARTEIAFLDGYSPGVWAPMDRLPRTSLGAFRLRPGRFALEAQSYCMHAGAHGPGGGDGYLYAPLAGPKAPIVRSILRNSAAHPEIPQRNIQVLIWAIIARTEFDEMPDDVQQTARALLTEDQIDELGDVRLGDLFGCAGGACLLGGSSVSIESIAWIGLATAGLPPSAQQMDVDEVHLVAGAVHPGELGAVTDRHVFTAAGGFDRSAVEWIHLTGPEETPPSGVSPVGGPADENLPDQGAGGQDDDRDDDEDDEADEGRDDEDDDGRYDDEGGEDQGGEDQGGEDDAFTFDPSGDVATPGNRSRQRLATSGRSQGGEDSGGEDECISPESCPPCESAVQDAREARARAQLYQQQHAVVDAEGLADHNYEGHNDEEHNELRRLWDVAFEAGARMYECWRAHGLDYQGPPTILDS